MNPGRACRSRTAVFVVTIAAVGGVGAVPAGASGWQEIPKSQSSSLDTAAAGLRLHDGSLAVVYRSPGDAPTQERLISGSIGPSGAFSPGVSVIGNGERVSIVPVVDATGGWNSLEDPALINDPSGMRLFWGGVAADAEPEPSLETSSAPTVTGPWNYQFNGVDVANCAELTVCPPPGDSAKLYSYAAPVSAVELRDQSPLEAWAGGSLGVFVHHGMAPDDSRADDTQQDCPPDSPASCDDDVFAHSGDFQSPLGACCGYGPQLAVDAEIGQPEVAWYSNAPHDTGVYVQEVNPTTGDPLGSPWRLPGSDTSGDSDRARTPLTARPGNHGLYTATQEGSESTKVVVASAPYTVNGTSFAGSPGVTVSKASGEVRNVNIAADSSGRLWVLWTRLIDNRPVLFASRSSQTGLRFGAAVSLAPPSRADDSYALDGYPAGDVLDVLATFGRSGHSGATIWHARLEPGQSVSVGKPTLAKGRTGSLAVHVSDAGTPLPNATVTVVRRLHVRVRTNRRGVAVVRIGPFTHSTTIHLLVARHGYTTTMIPVGVRVR